MYSKPHCTHNCISSYKYYILLSCRKRESLQLYLVEVKRKREIKKERDREKEKMEKERDKEREKIEKERDRERKKIEKEREIKKGRDTERER